MKYERVMLVRFLKDKYLGLFVRGKEHRFLIFCTNHGNFESCSYPAVAKEFGFKYGFKLPEGETPAQFRKDWPVLRDMHEVMPRGRPKKVPTLVSEHPRPYLVIEDDVMDPVACAGTYAECEKFALESSEHCDIYRLMGVVDNNRIVKEV